MEQRGFGPFSSTITNPYFPAAVGDHWVLVPFGTFTSTIRFRETTPLEPGAKSTRVYVQSLGPIVDDVVRLTGKTP